MNQSVETRIRDIIEQHLKEQPVYDIVYIKIVDNQVIVAESLEELSTWK